MIKPDSVIHFIQWVKNILDATRRANRAYCKYIVVKSKTQRMKRIQPNRVNTFHFVRMRKFPFWRMPSMYVIIFFSLFIYIYWQINANDNRFAKMHVFTDSILRDWKVSLLFLSALILFFAFPLFCNLFWNRRSICWLPYLLDFYWILKYNAGTNWC